MPIQLVAFRQDRPHGLAGFLGQLRDLRSRGQEVHRLNRLRAISRQAAGDGRVIRRVRRAGIVTVRVKRGRKGRLARTVVAACCGRSTPLL